MQDEPVVEYRYKNAIIRVYGVPDAERMKKAAERFVRRWPQAEAKKQQNAGRQKA